jgi:hypothetical protein
MGIDLKDHCFGRLSNEIRPEALSPAGIDKVKVDELRLRRRWR